MLHRLIAWALNSPLIVVLLALTLGGGGAYAFGNVNVEAYPDPAPAIIEVVAQYPGASAEEVERQVTIPLEIALAGMPHLTNTRTKSLAGLCHMRNQFDYNIDYYAARQEVINRLQFVQNLPAGVQPQISPFTPTGELVRYSLNSAKDADGRDIYSLTDLKAIEDWTLEHEFKRLPGIADVNSYGGLTKRYEIAPDPYQMQRYGISLSQLQNAVANNNANVGAGYLNQGPNAVNVRALGVIGRGRDPLQEVLSLKDPFAAERHLRAEGEERVQEIRHITVATVNNVPARVEDLVARGGSESDAPAGVFVGHQPRLGKVSISRPRKDARGRVVVDADGQVVWDDAEEKIQGTVLMRKGESTKPALRQVKEEIDRLNGEPGRLPPGVQIETHFDLTPLINRTTETVRENLAAGMVLVALVLLMFLSNVRSALIVALNIPLALLFAFSVLFLRGKSANLLSIGAVDFGIIVDSSVIMVENIYRHISSGDYPQLTLKERILRACREVEKPLLFSTLIMVCAFIPLFTMQGPEGQIFGPMADTYAFALGGALLLALTLSPVLCLLFFRNLKPTPDNFVVRWLRASYLRQLERCLNHRLLTLGLFVVLGVGTVIAAWFRLGFEFMPQLEEGNLYLRATLSVNVSLDAAADVARKARAIMRQFPEVELVQSQVGRPDDGTDPSGFYNVEFNVPLHPEGDWPAVVEEKGWFGQKRTRPRTKAELVDAMDQELRRQLPGIDWGFSQYIRDNVMESLSGVKGDNSVKIIGPDLDQLEKTANDVAAVLQSIRGVEDVGVFRIMGQPNLEFAVDPEKCRHWGVSAADVERAVQVAVGGQAASTMIEGEKTFDITLRWPEKLRGSEQAILDIPVEISNNTVTGGNAPSANPTPLTGASSGPGSNGTATAPPSPVGTTQLAPLNNPTTTVPRLRLGQLVTPVGADGRLDHAAPTFMRLGASTISREQGLRLIAVKFSVRGRDLGGAVAEAQQKTRDLIQPPYRAEWSGEFEEMQQAFARLAFWVPVSVVLVFVLLFLAFKSILDTLVVFCNVLALCMGGVWALVLTGNHFSISAAVGFISIFGVAIMDGLLSVSYFNALRARGESLRRSILDGAGKRVRPMMMTALTAILGLLPAAVSTRIGSQTQRPLAIVVVGGMLMTLLLNRYLMPVLYSFYGQRQPPAESGGMAH
jgi:cobalt-zinc-cadmium resistance protein CzcA